MLRLTQAEQRAKERQLKQAKQRFEVGVDPITSVHNAQAAFDAIRAEVIASEHNLNNQREALKAMTNRWYKPLKPIKPNLPLSKPTPNNIDVWVQTALQTNWEIRANFYQAQQAKYNLQQTVGKHLPELSGFGRIEESESKTRQSGANRNRASVIGAQLSISLFEGGQVYWQTKQAKQLLQEATAQLEHTKRQVIQQTRQYFNGVLVSISQIHANQQAVRSAQSALHSTEASVKAGTRTIVDLLAAQSDLSNTKRQLAATQYQYIKSFIRLKYLAGVLSKQDLQQVNTWLSEP